MTGGGERLMRIGAPVLVLAAAVAGFVYLSATRPEAEPKGPEERVWPVAVIRAAPADIAPEIKAFGQIFAGRQVELRPLVEGRVVETGSNFSEGGIVAKDDLLIAIDPFQYRTAVTERQAQLAEAEARHAEIEAELAGARRLVARDTEQVKLRQRDVRRREDLAKTGATSEKALDDSRLALSEARQRLIERQRDIAQFTTRLAQQKAVIERSRVALRQAERDLRQTRLVAPFAGFLTDVSTEIGKQVGKGDRVARLIDAGRLEARFQLSNENFGRLLGGGEWRGRAVRVVWSVGDRSYTYRGVVGRIEGVMDAAKGGVDLFARIDDAGLDTPLRPGAFVEVYVQEGVLENVIRIPDTALHDGNMIYVVKDGRLAAVKVGVVARTGGDVLIRGPVDRATPIVTTRFPEIAADLKVVVR